MLSVIKVFLFLIGGIMFVSFVRSDDFVLRGSGDAPYEGDAPLSDRAAYSRSYDTNNDGVISNSEYRDGELLRIADEVALLEQEVATAVETHNRSPYYDVVRLGRGAAQADTRREEYLILTTTSAAPDTLNITGWKVQSLVSKRGANIGKGIALLDDGNNPWRREKDILLVPGDSAVITTGSAAGIRTSFLVNKCMGYLDADRFVPSLDTGRCPLLQDEDLDAFNLSYNDFRRERDYDACMDAIEDVGSCEIVRSADRDLDDDCEDFIEDYSDYDGCIALHENDADFYGTEWRIFLESSRTELWREEREAIGLFDREGKIVDVVKY